MRMAVLRLRRFRNRLSQQPEQSNPCNHCGHDRKPSPGHGKAHGSYDDVEYRMGRGKAHGIAAHARQRSPASPRALPPHEKPLNCPDHGRAPQKGPLLGPKPTYGKAHNYAHENEQHPPEPKAPSNLSAFRCHNAILPNLACSAAHPPCSYYRVIFRLTSSSLSIISCMGSHSGRPLSNGELFANSACDPSGNAEGDTFLGAATATTTAAASLTSRSA